MSILANLSVDAQLNRRKGPHTIITRAHIDLESGEADGYEVAASIELFVAAKAYDKYIAGDEGWRRFLLGPDGVAYVHASAEKVEELARSL